MCRGCYLGIQLGLLCVDERYASLSVVVLVGRDSFTSVVYEAGGGAQDISARETIRLSVIFAIHLSSGFPSMTQRVLDESCMSYCQSL